MRISNCYLPVHLEASSPFGDTCEWDGEDGADLSRPQISSRMDLGDIIGTLTH